MNNEYRTRNFELRGFLILLLFRGFYACYKNRMSYPSILKRDYRTAEQGISNVEENTYFIILHSLFDIRYWNPCKKYQKQLSVYGINSRATDILIPEHQPFVLISCFFA